MSSGDRKRKRDSSSGSANVTAATGAIVPGSSAFPSSSTPSTSSADVSAQSVPAKDLNVIAFAEKRSREIRTLLDNLSTKKPRKRLFQQLPRHMRRRAMSYNVKRLPKRLRAFAEKETSKAKTPKRPRKKYRKRPKNKKIAYAKRQTLNRWLETHVWHAKRFHMVTKWGCKMADFPNDKGFRAAFRASASECLMTDLSYLVCIELEGPEDVLLEGIQQMTSTEIGRTFAYKDYRDGHMEGSCILYEPQKYPFTPIGPVKFIWQPSVSDVTDRKLNIFAHPSIYRSVSNHLIKIFAMNPSLPIEPEAADSALSIKLDGSSSVKMETVDVDGEMTEIIPKEMSAEAVPDENTEYRSSAGVILRVMKDQFVRFRLTGAKSTMVLKNVLKPADVSLENAENGWKSMLLDDSVREIAVAQAGIWTTMDSQPTASSVRPGSVLGLVVRDPRLLLPATKVFLAHASGSGDSAGDVRYPDRSRKLSFSPLWNNEIRERVRQEKVSDQDMNRRRSQLPAPGMELKMGAEESWIPVVLIRNGGFSRMSRISRSDYGAGWDIILPSGWAMSFWIPLVYNGARVGGQRELRTVSLHELSLEFPFDFPDSEAGAAEKVEIRKILEAKHQRYPPNKRPNFLKLGVASPFYSPWNSLVGNWIQFLSDDVMFQRIAKKDAEQSGFHVIRNLRLLTTLKDLLAGKHTVEHVLNDDGEMFAKHYRGLVPVVLNLATGGTVAEFALICAPNNEDFELKKTDKHFGGPTEPQHPDPFRRAKAKERRKLQIEQLLDDPDNVIDQCSRKTIGYVIKGGFSFIGGHEIGIGLCSLAGLLWLIQHVKGDPECTILVRSAHSFQYRFAQLGIDMMDFKF